MKSMARRQRTARLNQERDAFHVAAQELEAKRRAARGHGSVSIEFIGGVIPGNTGELEPLTEAGVCAFKCFLAPSGVPEFPEACQLH